MSGESNVTVWEDIFLIFDNNFAVKVSFNCSVLDGFFFLNVVTNTGPQFLYDLFHIHLSHSAPNISDFIVQLVRASHRYCEVTGSSPVEVLKFFRLLTKSHKLRSQLRGSVITSFDLKHESS